MGHSLNPTVAQCLQSLWKTRTKTKMVKSAGRSSLDQKATHHHRTKNYEAHIGSVLLQLYSMLCPPPPHTHTHLDHPLRRISFYQLFIFELFVIPVYIFFLVNGGKISSGYVDNHKSEIKILMT